MNDRKVVSTSLITALNNHVLLDLIVSQLTTKQKENFILALRVMKKVFHSRLITSFNSLINILGSHRHDTFLTPPHPAQSLHD